MGIGVGGRHEDYHAVGRRPGDTDDARHGRTGGGDETGVGRRKDHRSVLPVGPAPVQPGGPPLFVGSMGPKTVRSAAAWADGLAGTTLDLDVAKQNELFDVAREAWAQAGKPKPHLVTSFWFAFGSPEQARAQVHRHLRRYMNWIPARVRRRDGAHDRLGRQ